MKASKYFKETSLNKELVEAVFDQLGMDFDDLCGNVNDYIDASVGVNGFIYYSETHSFAVENRDLIIDLLDEQAEEFGYSVEEIVKGFGVFKGSLDSDDKKDLKNYLRGEEVEQGAVTNVLAWFALETVMYDLSNWVVQC